MIDQIKRLLYMTFIVINHKEQSVTKSQSYDLGDGYWDLSLTDVDLCGTFDNV